MKLPTIVIISGDHARVEQHSPGSIRVISAKGERIIECDADNLTAEQFHRLLVDDQPHSAKLGINVPFLSKPVGLGDVISAVTSAVGIQPCGGCKKRAAKLNKLVEFR